nr:MAG: minor tail protein [Bacteriophage sp.]
MKRGESVAIDVGSAVGYLDLDINGFLKSLKTAQNEAEDTTKRISSTIGGHLQSAGKNLETVGSTLTKTVTAPIIGLGGLVIKTSSTFESAMSRVQAVSGASGGELRKLNKKAQELGATTAWSASEVADGMTEMAKAGWSASDIIDGVAGALNSASASGEDLAQVSTIVADAITGFGLKAKDASRVADLLTQSANAGTIDITDLGESFKYISPIAKTMGFSIEDVTTAISAMSMSGIKGSQAGTALRTMFARMVKPTDDVKSAMDELGIKLTNSDGSFKSLNTIVSEMRGSFSGMTDEQKTYYATVLAGQEGMSGLLSLLSLSQGEYDKLADSMNNCKGVAEDTAKTMLDNFGGQLTILKSSLEGVAIQFGEVLLPQFKNFINWVQKIVLKLQSMTKEQKEQIVKWLEFVVVINSSILVFGKLISGIGKLMSAFGAVPKVIGTVQKDFKLLQLGITHMQEGFALSRAGFSGLGKEASALGSFLGGLSAPMIASAVAVGVLVTAFMTLWKTNEQFRNNMTATFKEITASFSAFFSGISERFSALGISLESIVNVIKSVWLGFCNLLAPIFESAFSQVSTVINTVLNVILGIVDVFIGVFTGNWTQAWNGVKEIFSSVWEGIKASFSNVGSLLGGVANSILSLFGTSLSGIWSSITGFFTNMGSSIVNAVSSFAINVVNKGKEMAANFANAVVTFFTDLPYKIGYFLGYTLTTIAAWTVSMVNSAREMGTNFINAVVTFFRNLPTNVMNFLTSAYNTVRQWDVNMANSARQVGINFVNNVVNFIRQLPSNVSRWFNSTINSAINFVNGLGAKGREAGQSLLNNVVNTARSIPSKMLSIGSNIVEGVWKGIMSAKNRFVSNVKGFFKGIVDGAKSALGIHSPSTVFANEIGIYLPPGVTNGFKSAMPAMLRNIQGMLNKGVNNLSINDIAVNMAGSVGDFSSAVKSMYNDIAVWFDSIDTRIGKSVDNMLKSLNTLIQTGNLFINSDGSIGYVGYNGFDRNNNSSGYVDVKNPKGDNGNGDTFIFNSPKPIDEIEASRQMKKTKQELAEGF